MKVYVDTNILIDLVCKRDSFYEDAKRLFALGYMGNISIVVSSLSFVNAVYIGKKYDLTLVKQRLKSILPFVTVCGLDASLVIDALDSNWKDYEDCVQDMSAAVECADCIITRNKKDFALSSIPIYKIDEFLSTLRINS